MPTLLCPVRGCRCPLQREERRVVCKRGHSFDVARSGYINLLQSQDRRSSRPGDSAQAVAARRELFDRGFAAPLVDATVDFLDLDTTDAVLDAGCGEGHHLAAIRARFSSEAHGVDISVAAIAAAAKRYPGAHWVVANADRFIPYANGSFAAITSINARMNPPEFRRILADDGVLLVAIPAPDDLLQLRESILAEGILRDRVERTVDAFAPLFALARHQRIRRDVRLDRAAIENVLISSYRALRRSERARMEALDDLEVTLSRDVLLFRPRESALP